MLGKLTQSEHYGSGALTEMVFDTSRFMSPDWFVEKLETVGFRHEDENGSPATWLPGNTSYPPGNLDDPEIVQEVLKPMPEGWHGYFYFYPETDPQTQVFRDGKLVGIIREVEGSFRRDEDNEMVSDFKLSDAAGAELESLKGRTRHEAQIALLNDYEIL
jgi:hypothetical protein